MVRYQLIDFGVCLPKILTFYSGDPIKERTQKTFSAMIELFRALMGIVGIQLLKQK